MVRWDDIKANITEVLGEFKQHKIGLVGVSLIAFMVLMGALAPVLAPNAHREWSPANERWAANPANAPPAWIDWVTQEDYARHQTLEWNGSTEVGDRFITQPGKATFDRQFLFDEAGNSTIEIMHEDTGNVLKEHEVTVQEREGIQGINVSDMTVDPNEGGVPLETTISATIENTASEDKNVPLEIPGEDVGQNWTIPAGTTEDVAVDYTFQADGIYTVYLAEDYEFVRVGAGLDVRVDNMNIIMDNSTQEAEVTGEIVNVGTQERTIRLRIFEVVEDGEDSLLEDNAREWTLSPGERQPVSYTNTFEDYGTYRMILGPRSETFDLQENTEQTNALEDDAGSLAETETEGEDDSSEGMELQQTGDIFIAEDPVTGEEIFEAPDQVTVGEIGRVMAEVENQIDKPQNLTIKKDGEVYQSLDIPQFGKVKPHYYRFSYNMDADVVPREMYFRLKGIADRYDKRLITIERPDGIKMTVENILRGRTGEFEDGITMQRRMSVRENIYSQAQAHIRKSNYNVSEFPDLRNVRPTELVFGKANENWFDNPEPLKGEYEITIQVDGINVEMENTEVVIGGAVFGVMGTDSGRRSIFKGWVWGARYGLLAGGIVALTTILFGTSFGMTSAYYGGWVDEFMQRLNEILMGIPTLPILIIVLRFWNRSIWVFVMIYALLMWRGAAKVIRSRGLQVAKDTYIEAAESLGSGSGRIIAKHMIPQILPYAVAQASLLVPIVIMAEAGLHILGLGDPKIVSWGTLLTEARNSGAVYNWERSWFWILFPGLGMILVGFGFISTGMAIERVINPKMKQR